jgi:type I restriction enzyme M protein
MGRRKRAAVQTVSELAVRSENGRIWSHVRQKWLVETPEERVRQAYLSVLANEYGFRPDQIDEEIELTGRGTGQARADFVIYRTPDDKTQRRAPLIVVECKSDTVTIRPQDYAQGDSYARIANAPFFVTHNSRETRFWRVKKDHLPGYLEEIEDIPHADATDRDIDELISRLKVFKEDEFAALLHQCHNVIRNREKKDPAAAFDEIAKVLFVKVYIERELRDKRRRKNLFTVEVLEEQFGDDPINDLFDKTKRYYRADRIFDDDERINLRPATSKEIVRLLERYNLSATSEDIKGIAFERFLGRTFRGEIGQFFTPRTIVEFMTRMVDPREGDVICDPASGSGGFLIRFFEIVREQILADVDRQYQEYKASVERKRLGAPRKAELLRTKFEELQRTVDPRLPGSRLSDLANRCIYGCDANDRMARTSKMNMIMHGDGHGGVHHHDGFINVNGIFEGRFDIVLTNPPFGANVEPSDVILDSDIAVTDDEGRRYSNEYGEPYRLAHARVQAARRKPIASLFELPRGEKSKVKTEILFLERCLALLKPGGRLGIVLPEGVFNNPSLARVREFCEDRAYVQAVVSLPQETFYSSGATVKASLLFLRKFTEQEQATFNRVRDTASRETRAKYQGDIDAETARLRAAVEAATEAADRDKRDALRRQHRDYLAAMEHRIATEARTLLRERFSYGIFLYEAEHVGITATGEQDANELYPNPTTPSGTEKTAVELYREFLNNPEPFFA